MGWMVEARSFDFEETMLLLSGPSISAVLAPIDNSPPRPGIPTSWMGPLPAHDFRQLGQCGGGVTIVIGSWQRVDWGIYAASTAKSSSVGDFLISD
jgi:hypothetical protein